MPDINDNKAGAAAVDPDDFNSVVDAVKTLQAGGGGGSLPDPSAEPDGDVLTVSSGAAVWASSVPTIYTGDAPIDGVGTVFKVQESEPSTSGTFTLTFRGDTTDPIAFDAGSQDISTALNLLASVNGNIAIVAGYEGLFLNVDAIRFVFTGALLGETEDPEVTNDLTDNGVTVGDISTGSAGDPVAPALYDLYVAGSSAFVYVFDGAAWNVTRVAASAITTAELADGAVTTAKIDGGAVTSTKIANGAVGTANLANGAVGTLALADNSVSSTSIVDTNVTTAKLANGAVTAPGPAGANAVGQVNIFDPTSLSQAGSFDLSIAGAQLPLTPVWYCPAGTVVNAQALIRGCPDPRTFALTVGVQRVS